MVLFRIAFLLFGAWAMILVIHYLWMVIFRLAPLLSASLAIVIVISIGQMGVFLLSAHIVLGQ